MPTVNSHGVDIYYEVHGDGDETLVFAHGMGGNAAIWFHQVAHYLRRYRIVTFDHRYFARSRCSEDAFSPALFADDALAIMDAVGIKDAVFICQSMGGWTGSQLAIRHPEKVRGLVMSHTPGVFEHKDAVNDRRAVAALVSQPYAAFGTPALAADYPEKNLAGAILYNQVSSFNGIDPAVIPRKIAEASIGVDVSSLEDYTVPTLFITADKDVLFPPAYIEALAGHVPGAAFSNLGDAGHSSYFEIPDIFNERLDRFLERLD